MALGRSNVEEVELTPTPGFPERGRVPISLRDFLFFEIPSDVRVRAVRNGDPYTFSVSDIDRLLQPHPPLSRKSASIFLPDPIEATPEQLFHHTAQAARYSAMLQSDPVATLLPRIVLKDGDTPTVLLYAKGVCAVRDGLGKGAWGIVHSATKDFKGFGMSHRDRGLGRLVSSRGPDGVRHPHSALRAQLSAAIAALKCRDWTDERIRGVVVAMDSSNIVKRVTAEPEADDEDIDLWQLLRDRIAVLADHGIQVMFWRVDSTYVDVAERFADAALNDPNSAAYERTTFVKCHGETDNIIAEPVDYGRGDTIASGVQGYWLAFTRDDERDRGEPGGGRGGFPSRGVMTIYPGADLLLLRAPAPRPPNLVLHQW